jgi:hypothetical protein
VFWLCDAPGEPGADATPFPSAGDDDLKHVLGPEQLVAALDSTFAIVEQRLDGWTLELLAEEVARPEWEPTWGYTRGAMLLRVFAHDVYHVAEVNEVLTRPACP